MSAITRLLQPLEVRYEDDAYASQGTHRWGNRDIYPIIKKERTYSTWAYFAYWFTAGICITSWTLGSSMIGIGLTAGQACGAVVIGSTFASILGFLAGQAGRTLYLSFTMMGRATFGLYGSYFSILICVFESLIYFGIQAYYGGQAVVVVLNSIFPQFLHLKNTLPESSGITTQALLGFLLYFVFYVPLVFVPPHKIYRWLYPNFVVICVTFAGILGWAIHSNGGPGDLVAPAFELSSVDRGFAMMSSICSVAGAYTGGSVRISDWTRFAKTRSAPVIPLFVAMPITVSLGALVGVLVTSAVKGMYGVIIWNPLLMLQHLQAVQYTPACRAGTFFAGAGLLCSQIFVNMTQNTVSCGMDLAGLVPKYLSMRRGGLLICALGIIIQPWRFLSQAQTFLTVLSSFGVFVAPMTGLLITDFWIVRRQHWKIPDLFREDGIYWYTWGLNWRAFLCFFLAIIPSMPGFVCAVNGDSIAVGWTRIYQLTYFVGLAIACPGYYILCRLSPPPGLRTMEYMDDELMGDDEDHQSQNGEAVVSSDPASDDASGVMVERKADRVSTSEKDIGSRV